MGRARRPKPSLPPLDVESTSYREWNSFSNCGCDVVLEFEKEPETNDQPLPRRRLYALAWNTHLAEVIPGLHVALASSEAKIAALRTRENRPFTHIVHLNYRKPAWNAPSVPHDWRKEEAPRTAGVRRLYLYCPRRLLRLGATEAAVGPEELHAASDFLSLALPYGNTVWWPEEQRRVGEWRSSDTYHVRNDQDGEQNSDEQAVTLADDHGLGGWSQELAEPVIEGELEVNALIVAPTHRAVDVLSVLIHYLEFLEGEVPEQSWDRIFRDRAWRGWFE